MIVQFLYLSLIASSIGVITVAIFHLGTIEPPPSARR
jgi:hypothetical protein